MNKKQRVIDAFKHKETDIIPYHVDFTIPQKEKLIKYFNDPSFEEKIDKHLCFIPWEPEHVELEDKPGHFKDVFGVVWNKSGPDKDIGVIEVPLLSEPTLKDFSFPKPDYDQLDKQFKKALKENQDRFTMATFGFSLFERAWTLRGMENLLSDMVLDPDFVHELFEKICDFNLELIQFALQYDFDGAYFGDDWGQQKGLITGPNMWREFIKPHLKKMYAPFKERNMPIAQHSCGDISLIFDDLIDIGLTCYNTFQPEIYDIKKIKNRYGNDLSFWGAISTQNLLPFGTPEEVRTQTIEIMRILGKNGGYIASPTHAVPYDVPCENIAVMLDVFENQDRYLR